MSFHKKYLMLLIYLAVAYRSIGYYNTSEFQLSRIFVHHFEAWVPFLPWVLPIYLSYFVFLLVPLVWKLKHDNENQFLKHMFFVSIVAQFCFLVFPTSVERYSELDIRLYWDQLIQTMYLRDYNNNCFPTLHAAHSLIIGLYFGSSARSSFLRIWAIFIALSTVLVRQHHWIDVLAACGLVLLVGIILKRKSMNIFKV